MKIKTLLIIFLLLTTSCVNTTILSIKNNNTKFTKNTKIMVVKNDSPFFSEVTYGKMMFSMLIMPVGIIAMKHAGNKIIKENDVLDPSLKIATNLSLKLKNEYDAQVIYDEEILKSSLTTSEMAKKYSDKADYIIDIKTFDWNIFYAQFDILKYRVKHISELRFIDVKNTKIVGQGYCVAMSNKKYSYDSLLTNKAQNLKIELENIVDFCEKKSIEDVF